MENPECWNNPEQQEHMMVFKGLPPKVVKGLWCYKNNDWISSFLCGGHQRVAVDSQGSVLVHLYLPYDKKYLSMIYTDTVTSFINALSF